MNITPLTSRVQITVPSKVDGSVNLPLQSEWVDRVLTELSDLFGGATAIAGTGGWVSRTDGLVKEPVVIVYSCGTDEAVTENRSALFALGMRVCQAMRQEAVSVEVNGAMYILGDELAAAAA